jgi:hypothetical protein
MYSMKHEDTLVIGGVDSHADTPHAAALDQRGALLATKAFQPRRLDTGSCWTGCALSARLT